MAKPETKDGSVNLMIWECIIPGKTGVSLSFTERMKVGIFFFWGGGWGALLYKVLISKFKPLNDSRYCVLVRG